MRAQGSRQPSLPRAEHALLLPYQDVTKMPVRLIHSSSLGAPALGRLGSGSVLNRSAFPLLLLIKSSAVVP